MCGTMGSLSKCTAGQVSAIIPTRNRPALLRAAIASVLAQTRHVDQILVVDDASDSTAWLSDIEAMSPAIEIVRRDRRGGVSVARNEGLARASGDFLFFLDDDDLVAPRLVETGLANLTMHPEVDLVFFRYRIVVSTEPSTRAVAPPTMASDPASEWLASMRFGTGPPVPRAILEGRPSSAFIRYLLPVHSGFLRRSAVGENCFPEGLRQGEDTYFWIALAAAGRRFLLDDHAYAVVRRHEGNTTRSRTRYRLEIQPCYEKLLAEGLLSFPEDVLLAHLKLLLFKALTRDGGVATHLKHVLASPRLLAGELRFWLENLVSRLRHQARESLA